MKSAVVVSPIQVAALGVAKADEGRQAIGKQALARYRN